MSSMSPEIPELFDRVYQTNRIQSLLHRWYSFYEARDPDLESQMDLLTEDFVIDSPNGVARGKEDYRKRAVDVLSKGSRNSHHLEKFEILGRDGNEIYANAKLLYQNLNSSGILSASELEYEMVVLDSPHILPQLKKIKLNILSPIQTSTFKDLYPENRVASLIHYYAAIFDKNSGDSSPFFEFFGKPFSFERPTGQKFADEAEFSAFFSGIPRTSSKYSAHALENLKVSSLGNSQWNAEFQFKWNAILVNGKEAQARTAHSWKISDRRGRYPLLDSVKVAIAENPS